MMRLFLFSIVPALIVSSVFAQTETEEEMAPGGSLSGTAVIELRVGVRQFLQGMEIALIPEEQANALKKIRNQRWLEQASRLRFNAGYYYLDLNAIGYFAVQHAVKRGKTDAQGRYEITQIPPGKYRLYAQYKSRYAAGYWLIPVEIPSIESNVTQDINNDNLEEIYNRETR